jgi:hypothetical protein
MTTIHIHVPDGCSAEPDPIRVMLEKIMSSLQDLEQKVAAQTAQLAAQGETIAALRVYVTGIETAVRDLASGEVLSGTMQTRVDNLVAMVDANAAKVAENKAGLDAAADGDLNT